MLTHDLLIRPASRDDVAALTDLIMGLGLSSASPEAIARQLDAALQGTGASVLVAIGATGMVGYVSIHWIPYLVLEGPEGFVSELFIDPGVRGQGLGTRLMDAVIREARSRGCARLHLVNLKDRASYLRGFYSKRGWTERPGVADFVLPLNP